MCSKYIILIIILISLSCCEYDSGTKKNNALLTDDVYSSDVKLPDNFRGIENINVYDSLDTPLYEIEFIEEQSFHAPNLLTFDRNEAISVSNSGLVFIFKGADIYVFNPDGKHIATMGGEGRGPGEHNRFASKEMRIGGNRLYTFDNQLKRINIYSLQAFEPTETIVFSPDQWERTGGITNMYPGGVDMTASKFYSFRDSLLLVRFDEPAPISAWSKANTGQYKIHKVHSHYYLMDRQGNILSSELLQLDYNYMVVENVAGIPPLPIHSQQFLAVSDADHMYTAYSKEFLVKVYDPNGSYQRALYFPTEKIPVDLENFISNYTDSQQIQSTLRESELPIHWPVIAGMLVDEQDRIWVPTYINSDNSFRWYVLGNKGEFVATFDWPANRYQHPARLGIRTIRDGFLYAFKSTGEDDFTEGEFVRYRIELKPKEQNNN